MDLVAKIDDREVREIMGRLERKLGNLTPMMQEIGGFYERRVFENFRNQTEPDGTPWKRLAAATLMMGLGRRKGWGKKGGLSAKGKRYLQGKRILWEHGDLEGSIHSQATANSVRIGSGGSIPYAAIHQLGGQAGRGRKVTIPARPFLALNRGGGMELVEPDRQRILVIAREYLGGD